MTTIETTTACRACGADLPAAARFCAHCGVARDGQPQQLPKRDPRRFATIALIGGVVFLIGWVAQDQLAGVKPTGHFSGATARNDEGELSTELTKLSEVARSRPDDIAGWKVLAGALVRELQGSEQPPSRVIFESMEAFTNILRLDPKDPDGLIAYADLSFNQRVFDKSVGLYERYLAVAPEDLNARSRYASALAFMQRYSDAVKELKAVLEKDPSNFHASAYLAITYAQMGKQAEAITSGEKALTLAPNDAARARFADFLKNVKTPPPGGGAPAAGAPTDASVEPTIVTALKNNPVAGPKFARFEAHGSTIHLHLREFPMSQMPPFAKDKFFAGLRGARGSFETAVFFETTTGQELERLDLTK